jgi:hypothetical protein
MATAVQGRHRRLHTRGLGCAVQAARAVIAINAADANESAILHEFLRFARGKKH